MAQFESWPIPHWEEDPQMWDRCVLGGFVLPGVWICNIESGRDIDKKKTKSKDGTRIRDNGYEAAEPLLVGHFHTAADWLLWQDVVRALHPQTFRNGKARGKQRSVLVLDHPNARLLGVTRVYLVSIQAPTFDNGIAEVSIELLQVVEPKTVPAAKTDEETAESPDALQGNPALRAADLSMPFDFFTVDSVY